MKYKKHHPSIRIRNTIHEIDHLVIAIVSCVLAVQLFFFRAAPLSEEKVSAMIEEKTKTYVTEEKEEEKEDNSRIVIPEPKIDYLPSY